VLSVSTSTTEIIKISSLAYALSTISSSIFSPFGTASFVLPTLIFDLAFILGIASKS